MIGETNINGGAGLNGKGALLKIKALTGSTITVSKESYSKTIKVSQLDPDNNNWSYWIFQTTNFGEWAVTATIGANTDSKTIVISDNKQYDLSLFTMLYLYNEGNENIAVTGGWSILYQQSQMATKEATYLKLTSAAYNGQVVYTSDKIPLHIYSKICFTLATDFSGQTYDDDAMLFVYADSVDFHSATVASKLIPPVNKNITVELDISSITGSRRIGFRCYNAANYNVNRVWLE